VSVTQFISMQGTVLVVDDDAASRALMGAALAQAGLGAIEACDGAEAIEQFAAHQPDIVILDVQMPGIDGFETCAQLRASPGGAHVPIMMVTGDDDVDSVNRAYDVGATDFLPKPIPWALVGHRVRYLLRAARLREELQRSEQRHRALLGALPDMVLVLDERRRIVNVLGAAEQQASLSSGKLEGRSILSLLPAAAATDFSAACDTVESGRAHDELEFSIARDGITVTFESRVARYDEERFMVVLRDVTEKRRAEQQVRDLTNYDSLTGLPNRRMLSEMLVAAAARARGDGGRIAVIHVAIDRFRRINEGFGPAVGDRVLREVADRLREVLADTPAAVAARFAGDEFSVLLKTTESADAAAAIARSVADVFIAPLHVGDREFYVSPAIGMAILPDHTTDIATLLRLAHTASSGARSGGGGGDAVAIISSESQRSSLELLELEADLHKALDSRQGLSLAWQPQIDMQRRRLIGFEALVRWTHPQRGSIPPSRFIPIAEESALIAQLSDFVLEAALAQCASWRRQGLGDLRVAVNLSGAHFMRCDMAEWVSGHLARSGVPPRLLELEITEGLLMRDVEQTTGALAALKALGTRLAVDDFGTGYSSLAYLKRFTVDALKIDRSFVKDLTTDSGDAAICSALIAMSHRLGLEVVAEGIETGAQLAYLREQGCDIGQGFYLGKPMPADETTRYLQQLRRRGRAAQSGAAAAGSGDDLTVEEVATVLARGNRG
jgi:diguanylate cyclase (GGDEF)-like protein/PAS domain S-box-containing protein